MPSDKKHSRKISGKFHIRHEFTIWRITDGTSGSDGMWCSLHFIRLSIRTCRDYHSGRRRNTGEERKHGRTGWRDMPADRGYGQTHTDGKAGPKEYPTLFTRRSDETVGWTIQHFNNYPTMNIIYLLFHGLSPYSGISKRSCIRLKALKHVDTGSVYAHTA